MPYQHCPSCRLTVHVDDEVVRDGPCPRCGEQLADEPRRLFASAPAIDPETVRLMLQTRGGRFRRAPTDLPRSQNR